MIVQWHPHIPYHPSLACVRIRLGLLFVYSQERSWVMCVIRSYLGPDLLSARNARSIFLLILGAMDKEAALFQELLIEATVRAAAGQPLSSKDPTIRELLSAGKLREPRQSPTNSTPNDGPAQRVTSHGIPDFPAPRGHPIILAPASSPSKDMVGAIPAAKISKYIVTVMGWQCGIDMDRCLYGNFAHGAKLAFVVLAHVAPLVVLLHHFCGTMPTTTAGTVLYSQGLPWVYPCFFMYRPCPVYIARNTRKAKTSVVTFLAHVCLA